ncbi:MAG: hypothetical protein JWM16_1544, partial [Verrucomicrobiales bacterium]|nr:hypothetical protein [Verrucomicrobiales bacterium]
MLSYVKKTSGVMLSKAMFGFLLFSCLSASSEPAKMPFSESFTSNKLANFWTVSGTGSNRVTVSNSGSRSSPYNVVLDSAAPNTYSRNELTLTIDLYWFTNVTLSFSAKGFHDEPHGPPPSPFTGGADFDGVAMSTDGVNWYEIQSLRALTTNYTRFSVSMDPFVKSNNLSYTSNFFIRFNQYDDFPAPSDGIAIDDIAVGGALRLPLPDAPNLEVSPLTGLTFTGLVNGPFSPSAQSFVVSNTSISNLTFAVSSNVNWLSITSSLPQNFFGYQLAGNKAAAVTVSIVPSQAGFLQAGSNVGRVQFINNSGGTGSTTQNVSLILVSNTPPTAFSQTLILAEDSILPIQLDGSDPDGQPLTTIISRLPDRGTLYQTLDGINPGPAITNSSTAVSNSSRRVIYVPYRNENGSNYASFGFRMRDDRTNSPEASIVLHVTPMPDLPRAIDDRVSTLPGESTAAFDPVANDEHPDGVPLTLVSFTQPDRGIVTQRPDGLLVYTPRTKFLRGLDTFTYTIQDPFGQTSSAKVNAYVGVLMSGDWPMDGGDPARTGYYPGKLGSAILQQRWLNRFSNDVGQVAIGQGKVFISWPPLSYSLVDTNLIVLGLDLNTGVRLWQRSFTARAANPPTYAADRVYIQPPNDTLPNQLFCLDASNGQSVWVAEFSGYNGYLTSPAVLNDTVWIRTGRGLRGISTNGQSLFLNPLIGPDLSSFWPWTPSYYKGAIYCWNGAALTAADPLTGTPKWTTPPLYTDVYLSGTATAAVDGDRVVILGPFSCSTIDLNTHQVAWSIVATNDAPYYGAFRGKPLIAGGVVYCVSTNGVKSFRASDGTPIHSYEVDDWSVWPWPSRGAALVTADCLFVASASNTYLFRLNGELQQIIPYGGELALADGTLIISSPDGSVTAWAAPVLEDLTVLSKSMASTGIIWQAFFHQYSVTNSSSSTFSNMLFVVQYPTNAVFNGATSTQGSMSTGNGYVLFLMGDIQAGSSISFELSFTATNLATFVSNGRIVYPPNDAIPGNEYATATTTISPVTINFNSVSIPEGNSGISEAVFPLWLSSSNPFPVRIQYYTIPYSATPTNDYLPIQGILTFPPGVITQVLRVPIVGNSVYESDKLFRIDFTGLTNATYGLGSDSTIRIVNDDPPPIWTISDATVLEGNEGVKNVQFTVSYSLPPLNQYLQREWQTVDGTAIAGLDYMSSRGTLYFTPGVTSQVVTVSVIGDNLVESDEYFYIKLLPDTNSLFAKDTATCWILNDDGVSNSIHHFEWSGVPSTQPVNAPFPGSLLAKDPFGNTVAGFQGQVDVSWADLNPEILIGTGSYAPYDGGDTFNTEYRYTAIYKKDQLVTARRMTGLALDLTQPPLQTLQHFTLRLKHTAMKFYSGGYGSFESNGWTTVYEAEQSLTKTGWTYFAFSAPFDYNGVDSLMLDLSFFDPSLAVGIPSFRATLTPEIQALRYGGNQVHADLKPLTGPTTPAKELLNVRFFGDESPVAKQNISFTNGIWTGLVQIPLPGTNILLRAQDSEGHTGISTPISAFLTNDVSISVSHTNRDPVANVPYTLKIAVLNSPAANASGVIVTNTLPGSWSVVSATSSAGSCASSNETVVCTIGSMQPLELAEVTIVAIPGGRGLGTNFASVRRAETELYLQNNDARESFNTQLPVFLSVSDLATYEPSNGAYGSFFFKISLAAPSSFREPVTFSYTTEDGTASSNPANRDYVDQNGYLTIVPGTNSQTIRLDIQRDDLVEEDETFTVRISGATNALISRASASVTIGDSTPVILGLSATNVGILEGAAGTTNFLAFSANLQRPSVRSITVHYETYDITALAGSDYVSTAGMLIFPPGITNQVILVPVIGDDLGETNETFGLRLSSVTNASLVNSVAVGTITNDDLPSIRVDDANLQEYTFTNVGGSFRVSIMPASSNAVQVSFYTMGGSAIDGKDFVGTNGTLTLPPGQTATNIPITILPDRIAEGTKSFFLVLTNPFGANLADNIAQGFILDADSPGQLIVDGFSVDDSLGDKDGGVDPGETIKLVVRLRNTMGVNVDGARGTIMPRPFSPAIVDILRSNTVFPMMVPGSVVTNSLPYILRFKKGQHCGRQIYFDHVAEFGGQKYTNYLSLILWTTNYWGVSSIDPAHNSGKGCAAEMDGSGQLHVTYIDKSTHFIRHAVNSGEGWRIENVGAAMTNADVTALGLSSNGTVQIIYPNPDGSLTLASLKGSNWVYEAIPDSFGGLRPSLVVSSEVAHVSFYNPSDQCLRYARFDGTNWISQAVDCGPGGRGHFNSVAIYNGMPRIAYTDGWTNGLKFALWTGSSWSITNLDTAEAHGSWAAMRLNAAGEPTIAYADMEQNRGLLLEKRGGKWTNSIFGYYISPPNTISLRLDAQGNPYLANLDQGYDRLHYAYRNGDYWNGPSVEARDSSLDSVSLVLGSNAVPIIAFHGNFFDFPRIARPLTCSEFNTAPVAFPQMASAKPGTKIPIQLMGYDFDQDPLTWNIVASPSHGVLTNFISSLGTVNYLASPGFEGLDAFTYQVSDGLAFSPPAMVTLEIFIDSDGDGMSDSWELAHGLNPLDPNDAGEDPDGDGVSNLAEFRAQTNQRDPTRAFRIINAVQIERIPHTSLQ